MKKSSNREGHLKRLPEYYYRGTAWVHWVMTIENRRWGWLDGVMHGAVREALLHTCTRYRLVCPVYALMPDHAHLIWCGCAPASDQLKASSFFRRQWNESLRESGYALQKQPYEHVLIDQERDLEAFQDTCAYVMKNSERAKLVTDWREWKCGGSVVPGYPWMDPREDQFWPKFWTAHNEKRELNA